MPIPAQERHKQLAAELAKNPFLLDEQLATLLKVSIHTIRSDRRKAGIPEVRKRGDGLSDALYARARTLSQQEIVGELLEVDLDHEGLSLLDTTPEMGLRKSGIIRGHWLFAQANTLANAIVDADVALTGDAQVRFLAPMYVGERALAKARMVVSRRHMKKVQVAIKTKDRVVFEGVFTIYCLSEKLATDFRLKPQLKSRGSER
jgi:acyl-coenzyme A thioesterase PaaI-like protein